jgi:hypothetical protein
VDKAIKAARNQHGQNGVGVRRDVLLLHLRPWQDVPALAAIARQADVRVLVSGTEEEQRALLVKLLPLLPAQL